MVGQKLVPEEESESIYSVCYTSIETKPLDRKSINKLVHHANRFNSENGITGVLCYKNSCFFQYIEGPKDAISALIERIKIDRRHTITALFYFPSSQVRRFVDWSLLHVNTNVRGIASVVQSIHRVCERESDNTDLSESSLANLHMLIDCLGNDPFQDNFETDAAGKKVIAIGASAGGIEPIRILLSSLPSDLSASIMVVLHLSPNHETVLDEILERETGLTVKLAESDDVLLPGIVYLIPPNKNLEVILGKIRITDQCRDKLSQ